jgi:hypothetical protein
MGNCIRQEDAFDIYTVSQIVTHGTREFVLMLCFPEVIFPLLRAVWR